MSALIPPDVLALIKLFGPSALAAIVAWVFLRQMVRTNDLYWVRMNAERAELLELYKTARSDAAKLEDRKVQAAEKTSDGIVRLETLIGENNNRTTAVAQNVVDLRNAVRDAVSTISVDIPRPKG